jgi:hypothetical protein
MSYKSEAMASQSSKLNRMVGDAGGGAHSTPKGSDARVARKSGGRVCYANGGMVEEMIEGEMSSPRFDRPSRKGKGATTVNVSLPRLPRKNSRCLQWALFLLARLPVHLQALPAVLPQAFRRRCLWDVSAVAV